MTESKHTNNLLLPGTQLPILSLCDSCKTESGFIHPDRIMDSSVLLYVKEGGFHLYEEDYEITLRPGDLVFLKQGLHHWGDIKCPAGTEWFFVHFHINENTDSYSVNGNNQHLELPKIFHLPDHSALPRKFLRLEELFESKEESSRLYINVFLCEILLDIYNESKASERPSAKDNRVREVVEIVRQHLNETFSAEVIAKEIGLSYKHLNNIVKSSMKMTIQQLHTRLRLEEAAVLLRDTNMTILEISEALGYEEPFYFSNSFKKQYGSAPSEYRKKQLFI